MNTEAILVVDDDAIVLDFCCSTLSRSGYRVLRAEGGRQALEIHKREKGRIDLALVDIVMPEMTGIELVKRLQTGKHAPKVALMSGYSPEEVRRLIGDDGSAYRVFWKPFAGRVFLQMIRNVLDKPHHQNARRAHT